MVDNRSRHSGILNDFCAALHTEVGTSLQCAAAILAINDHSQIVLSVLLFWSLLLAGGFLGLTL